VEITVCITPSMARCRGAALESADFTYQFENKTSIRSAGMVGFLGQVEDSLPAGARAKSRIEPASRLVSPRNVIA
jgi:hypothetical protein